MAKTTPTEESLGLAPTEEELATSLPDMGGDDPTEEAEAAPAEAAPAEPAAPEKPADPPQMVDVRAVQEARAEAREAKQRAAVLEQRWNEYIAAQNAPKPAEKPAIPGPDDPLARINWTTEQVVAFQEQQAREAEERTQQQQQQQAFQQVLNRVTGDYNAAVEADPTVAQAYDKLRESQGNELLAMGLSIPEAKAQLDRIEREHIAYVAQRGLPIGDYLKALARARGWTPQQAAAAPATPAPKTDLAAVAAAQQRHRSLSDAPGGEGVAPLDAKALAKMSDKEFKAWMSKKGNEARFDEIMGAG